MQSEFLVVQNPCRQGRRVRCVCVDQLNLRLEGLAQG